MRAERKKAHRRIGTGQVKITAVERILYVRVVKNNFR
nr:MAG TPA: hypothetical protein [Caudoviricetes sp.]DAW32993.1 MAG TPA: hypothetical protein [Caudoviricetes sp.]